MMLTASQRNLLGMIAGAAALPEVLDAIVRMVEAEAPDMLCSILLADGSGKRLRQASSSASLAEFSAEIDGEPIGPTAGSCGTAAYRRQLVVVRDIAVDPLWAMYRDLALRHKLRAGWSQPILSFQEKLLGTFAM